MAIDGVNGLMDRLARTQPIPFSATRQCCWCGSDNTRGSVGYAGERMCPKCGWGGDGERDVPCMFYKLAQPPTPSPATERGPSMHGNAPDMHDSVASMHGSAAAERAS